MNNVFIVLIYGLILILGLPVFADPFQDLEDYVEQKAQPFYSSPIIRAVVSGDMDQLERVIAEGYDLDAQDDTGQTALYKAVTIDRADMIRLLLHNGADATIVANNGFSPLSIAAQNGANDIIRLLVDMSYKKPADINYRLPRPYGMGWTALHIAILKDNNSTVALLLELGANPYIQTFDGMNALEFARFYNATGSADILERYMI